MAQNTKSGGPSIYGDVQSQFGAQNGITTEQDLIRLINDQQDNQSKFKPKHKAGQNINNWIQNSTDKQNDQGLDTESFAGKSFSNESSFKLCTRIWSGYTKFVRSQCNKGRQIDSIYFGSFFKKEVDKSLQDQEKPDKIAYICIHDSKKMTEQQKPTFNTDNLETAPTNVEKRDLVAVNIKAISQVCGCSAEQVSGFLIKLRDTAFSYSANRKRIVCLNFAIGQFWIYPNSTFEFKSHDPNSQPYSQSVIGMADPEKGKLQKKDNSIFYSASHQKSKIQSLLKDNSEQKDFSHLSDFLKNQIYRGQGQIKGGPKSVNSNLGEEDVQADTFSNISKKNKYSNALIEQAAIEAQKRKEQLTDKNSRNSLSTKSEGKLEKIKSLQSPYIAANKDQVDMADEVASYISNQKGNNMNHEMVSDKKSTIAHSQAGSYLSQRLNRGNVNGKSLKNIAQSPANSTRFMTYASEQDKMSQGARSKVSRVVKSQSQSRRLLPQAPANQGPQSQTQSLHNRKNSYEYPEGQFFQSKKAASASGDPFLNDYNITRSQKDVNKFHNTTSQLFNSNQQNVQSRAFSQNMEGVTQQPMNVKKLIGMALNRKQISGNYHHNAYPYFLRSQGPFKVYDHAKAKGQQYVQNLQEINQQAHNRFTQECEKIKEIREFEREQFGWSKKKQDIIANHNQMLRRKNNDINLQLLAYQIEADRARKIQNKEVEKLYYKPHFGPEETDDALDKEALRQFLIKKQTRQNLIDQIQVKANMNIEKYESERFGDQENLQQCQNMFVAEERARQAKNIQEKIENKANWQAQMQDRVEREKVDKMFY